LLVLRRWREWVNGVLRGDVAKWWNDKSFVLGNTMWYVGKEQLWSQVRHGLSWMTLEVEGTLVQYLFPNDARETGKLTRLLPSSSKPISSWSRIANAVCKPPERPLQNQASHPWWELQHLQYIFPEIPLHTKERYYMIYRRFGLGARVRYFQEIGVLCSR
jgi:hypothetical protein